MICRQEAGRGSQGQNGPATPIWNLTSGLACGRFPALGALFLFRCTM